MPTPINVRSICLAAAGAVLLPLGLAGPAHAASWTTVANAGGARAQACKVSIDNGKAWRIRVRLVNRSQETAKASFSVTKNGSQLIDRVQIRKKSGQVSATKRLTISNRKSYTLSVGVSTAGGALGDTDILSVVGRC